MLEGMMIFAGGIYAGILLKQRYRVPHMRTPMEFISNLKNIGSWEKPSTDLLKKRPGAIMDQLKEAERSYRK